MGSQLASLGSNKKISDPDSVARPFLKWVGGKRQILGFLRAHYPVTFKRYHEPFVGGGAVYFDLKPASAVLSDCNDELVNCYGVVRDHVEALIEVLGEYTYDKDQYYRVRAQDPDTLDPVRRAARMIYLNKTGFNGLYRVNSKGQFNVPFGRHRNPHVCDADNLRACSISLGSAEIKSSSFEEITGVACKGDFVYFDPPYIPLSQTANFTAYQKRGFGMDNQEKLATVFERLARKGVHVMLSNSDVPWIRERYAQFHLHEVSACRNINSDVRGRGPVGELLVTSY